MDTANTLNRSPYEVLKINHWSDDETIKAHYFHLTKQYNPEYYPQEFTEIRKAYDVLRDAETRAAFDVENFTSPPPYSYSDYSQTDAHSISQFKLKQEMKALCGDKELDELDEDQKAKALHLLRGVALYHCIHGNFEEAQKTWDKILRMYPEDAETRENITYSTWQEAYDLAIEGQYADAETLLLKMLEEGVENGAVFKNLALAQEKQGKKDESRENWEKAIQWVKQELKKDPNNEYLKAWTIACHKYTGGRFLEGKGSDGESGPINAANAKELGYACIKQGNWARALEALDQARQDHPNDLDVLCQLGWAFLNTNQHHKAFQTWNHALKLAPGKQSVLDHLVRGYTIFGKRLMDQGIHNQALVQFKNALKYEPGNVEIRVNLAEAYFKMRNFTSAVAEYQKILENDPRHKVARQGVREAKRLGGLR
ncbi:MAG: tetratricopeptide repeat protein [bacterium]|nr:tetratricopeptide repeat protein [bacterium]